MKQSKSFSQKKAKPKPTPNKQPQPKQHQTAHPNPFQTTITLLQQDVIRLQNTIQFYKTQIHQLQKLNLQLYHQLQQSKIKQESMIRNSIIQHDVAAHKNNELCVIVSQIEKELVQWRVKGQEMEGRWKEMELRLKGQEQSRVAMREAMRELQVNVQKYKVKLLQSQKYWITRIQTVLGQKQIQNNKVLQSKDDQLKTMSELYLRELTLKDKIIRQKTQQIYKLITHIRRQAD